jgi:cyanophycin synthetase
MTGDCTGPGSAEFVLRDPTVNLAVLECARGGLLRSGLHSTL